MSDFNDIEDLKEENFEDVDPDTAYEDNYNDTFDDTFDDALDDTYNETFDDDFDDYEADSIYDDEFDEKPAPKKTAGRPKKSGKTVKNKKTTVKREEPEDFDDIDAFDDEYFDDQAYDEEEDTHTSRRRTEPVRRRTGGIKKTSTVDDFREWLSDNLRYFMLGGIVLLIVLVIIFAVRGCKGKDPSSDIENPAESTTTVADPAGTEPVEKVIANPLEPAETGIVSLVNERFAALAAGDLEAVRALQTDLSAVDEARIASDSAVIDSYTTKDVYTKAGMADGEYVTYVSYETNYSGYSTPVPMLDELYVITTGDGSLIVDSDAPTNPDKSAYTDLLKQDSDLKKLISDVQSAHDAALASDAGLSSFLSGMGDAVQPSSTDTGMPAESTDGSTNTGTTADGPTMTVTAEVVNMRSAPGGDDSEIIDGIPYGTSVVVLGTAGENGDWYQVEYNGQTGYVYSEYLAESY